MITKAEALRILRDTDSLYGGSCSIGKIFELAAHAIAERLAEGERAHAAALAARDVELAEMAEVIRFVREGWFERHYPSDIFSGVSGDEGVLDVIEIKERLDLALSAAPAVCPDCGGSGYLRDTPNSAGEFCPCMGQPIAAPAGGRVLWRGMATAEDHETLYLDGKLGKEATDAKCLEITIRKPPCSPSADEE